MVSIKLAFMVFMGSHKVKEKGYRSYDRKLQLVFEIIYFYVKNI